MTAENTTLNLPLLRAHAQNALAANPTSVDARDKLLLVQEVERLRRIETLAHASVQPNGRMLSIDTNALKALMEAVHAK